MVGEAEVVIIAGANDTQNFDQTAHCPLEPVRGQISMLPQSAASARLATVLCSDGYLSPAHRGMHCAGATFSPGEATAELRIADHQQNIEMARHMLPGIHDGNIAELEGRAAVRCATADYLPMAGLLLDAQSLAASPPRHNADPATLPWLHGLYVNTGHGSKGLVHAPLCAEILASAICGEPMPVGRKLLSALDPNRFLLRSMGLKRLALGLAAPSGKMPADDSSD